MYRHGLRESRLSRPLCPSPRRKLRSPLIVLMTPLSYGRSARYSLLRYPLFATLILLALPLPFSSSPRPSARFFSPLIPRRHLSSASSVSSCSPSSSLSRQLFRRSRSRPVNPAAVAKCSSAAGRSLGHRVPRLPAGISSGFPGRGSFHSFQQRLN